MAFVDEITLKLKAGDGGDGIIAWHKMRGKPLGGPAGGDGGRGGDVAVVAVHDLAYLSNYRFKREFKAEDGGDGRKKSMEGKNGDTLYVKLPLGSVITNKKTGQQWSLDTLGQEELVLRGGRGGFGNEHFKSSKNTSPYEQTDGKPGEEGEFYIELQLFADIGLIGLPSAGKSTLLNALTNAQSKTAAYHFTTLEPHLGVIPYTHTIIADIPGLIEGASVGKGLGHKFLRHVKRTKKLVHLISVENEDVASAYNTIRNELETYDPTLLEKEEIVVLSKIDLVTNDEIVQKKRDLELVTQKEILTISTENDDDLKRLARLF